MTVLVLPVLPDSTRVRSRSVVLKRAEMLPCVSAVRGWTIRKLLQVVPVVGLIALNVGSLGKIRVMEPGGHLPSGSSRSSIGPPQQSQGPFSSRRIEQTSHQ